MDDRIISDSGPLSRIRLAGSGRYSPRWRGGPVFEADCKLYAAQEGEARYAVEQGGAWREVRIRAGDVVLIPGARRHRYATARGWRLRWMHLPIADGALQRRLAHAPAVLRLPARDHVAEVNALAILDRHPDLDSLDVQCRLQSAALGFLASALALVPETPPLGDERMRAVRAWCDRHWREPPDRAAIAAVADLSVPQLQRRFRAAFGCTPHAYLEGRRLAEAQRLLRLGGTTVSAVAAACGYEDPYYFSRVFRRRIGVPPSEYALRAEEP